VVAVVLLGTAGPGHAVIADAASTPLNLPTLGTDAVPSDTTFDKATFELRHGHHREAIRLWELSAAAGNPRSQHALGALYSGGDATVDVTPDYQKAVEWFRRAADEGYAPAQFDLGICFATGRGVPRDMLLAARWWEFAAAQGHVEAQFNLGLLYAQGEGVNLDMSEAAKWWHMAAAQGYAPAQFNLGIMYVKGEGVQEDPNEALRLWQLSARQGFGQAVNILKTLQLNP
jgi:TPR repeat protein